MRLIIIHGLVYWLPFRNNLVHRILRQSIVFQSSKDASFDSPHPPSNTSVLPNALQHRHDRPSTIVGVISWSLDFSIISLGGTAPEVSA
jgi:hypothetical protein